MKIGKLVSINLKYYRKKYNLSQEKFADVIGTSLSYLNQIENNKVDLKASTIDKFVENINKYDKTIHLVSEDLVKYNEDHLTNFKRIDEKNK